MGILGKLFGSHEREVSRMQPLVEKVNALEAEMQQLTDEGIIAKTAEFKKRIAEGATTDDLLPEAFALVREASVRTLGLRHFDVQILGGAVLHSGKIAEMKTGEGKTLTSTLPIYLNALTGKGVHVVTVNDYLARRDCNWMGGIYSTLGLSVACITHEGGFLYEPKNVDQEEVDIETENLQSVSKKEAYDADITYGTNNEFGFDYLRDNMAQSLDRMVQRVPHYAIVDEVDSILIDEARTPLIISAPDAEGTALYGQFAKITPQLQEERDFTVDEKMRSVTLTDDGIAAVEKALGMGNIYEEGKIQYVHHLEQSLKAQALFTRDKDYMVRDGQVIIIDEFTGRAMEGRRYSDGLHQAIEAKEGVDVQQESRTLATITFQNYFRMYDKLAGMTGTASSSAEELFKVYELDVVAIPTHRDMIRDDRSDIVYKNERGKFLAIVAKIKELHDKGQPVLVGTVAIEKSEELSTALQKAQIPHSVLNAKHHEKEAQIITDAGKKGAVTIATNMAGRGTDIKVSDEVKALGGLYIIGTERHEARRIDDQLRGRSGRQGDPGTTQFYISLDDELMRRFGGERLQNMMERLGLPEDQPIENSIITKQIEGAQKKIEGFNFDIRKHVLDYDDVVNKQRTVIYKERRELLEAETLEGRVEELIDGEVQDLLDAHAEFEKYDWNLGEIVEDVQGIAPLPQGAVAQLEAWKEDESKDDTETREAIKSYVTEHLQQAYTDKQAEHGADVVEGIVRTVTLRTIDQHWMNHLDAIEYLRQGIGLRGYGQRDPLIEYKREALGLFRELRANIRRTALQGIFRTTVVHQEDSTMARLAEDMELTGAEDVEQFADAVEKENAALTPNLPKIAQPVTAAKTPGRNDPCPCGSGKKYKKCHGR